MKNEYCPNCGAIWGWDEMERECCFSCGYPDFDLYDYDTDDLDAYDESDRFDLVE